MCRDARIDYSRVIPVYSTTIWVGHIKGTLLTEEFRKMLEQFGPVSDVEVST